jgi:hypothetical protein
MRFLRGRRGLLALALIALAAAAVAAIGAVTRNDRTEAIKEKIAAIHAGFKAGDPDAQTTYAAHTHRLGNPESYAAEQLAALAYPADSLSASLLDQESKFYTGVVKGRTKTSTSGWQLAGPSTATQPAVLNFFDNQASDLGVSGRVTALAVDSNACDTTSCRVWVAAAGGGIWRTDNALAATPSWTFLSGNFGTNAIGTLTYDAASHTLYAGTGEPNASGDSESGVGIYASNNGGTTWTYLSGSVVMKARSISSIAVDPSHPGTLYVGDARGVRGVSAVTGGAVSLAPDAKPWGLWKTTDGGKTFTEVWNGNGSIRGVNHVEIDSHGTVYAAAFQQGIWRSGDGGSTWGQVFATQDPGNNAARTEFALNTTADRHTRIYVGDGGEETGADQYGLPTSNTGAYRADAIDTKSSADLTNGSSNPGFESLTSSDRNDPKWGTYDYCEGQCWYDNYVVSPAGHPDTVYVGGSFDYSLYSFADNGKAVLLSTDGGETWTDQTRDVASPTTGIHPDQHALAVDPANPLLFFEGSDGGVVHSSGQLADGTGTCPPAKYGEFTAACENVLKAVPTQISTINSGLSTLQFQGIATHGSTIIGGTQDNGTWLGTAGNPSWNQTIYGDGGVAAFDASNTSWGLNEFFGSATDANFENGNPTKWVIVDGTFASSGESSAFYKPQLGDPVVAGTSFVGLQSVWRTQDNGGNRATLEAKCPEFTAFSGTSGCGDFAPLGDSSGKGGKGGPSDLTGKSYGSDRTGGYLVALARSTGDRSTLWAATLTGRVFVSSNADNASAGKVSFTRIDNSTSPQRFVSGIVVDPSNQNHAWVTYTGYNANTPSTPGHVFEVVYDPTHKTATWKDIDNGTGPLGDLPVTSIVRDNSTGTLYAGTDFTVLASSGDGSWAPVADGMPQVEITDLTIDSGTLYAATHGRGIWSLHLH